MKTSTRPSNALTLVSIARRFPDDATARAFLESVRWPDGPVCPHCGTVNDAVTIPANVAKKVRPGLYRCRVELCGKQFTVTVGTVFEASKVSLSNWLIAWHLVCASKKGIAALELQRLLGIGSYRTAWFMLMRIRESLKSESFDGSPLKGEVEMDATFVGGRTRNATRYRDKTAVIAMVSRDGEVRSVVAPKEDRANVERAIEAANVSPCALLLTDGAHAYKTPGKGFAAHLAVDHAKGEFVRKVRSVEAHTGTADAFFGLVKRAHYGTFHSISKKYLGRYMVEFDYRFSRRHATDGNRTVRSLAGTGGKRLRFADLKAAG